MGGCLSACQGGGGGGGGGGNRRGGGGPNGAASRRSSAYSASADASVKRRLPGFGMESHYRTLQLLGAGGTGSTYLCEDVRDGRRVAIKFISRPLAKVLVPMVSQEIQLQARLSEGHIGLVKVESAVLSKSHLGLVMEYVDGGTLTQYVSRRTASRMERGGLHLVEDEARYFLRQILDALEYLHNSHVAHRDLKMCNVVLTTRKPPTLKLCDFGFAKGWDDNSQMNTRIGTPVYMSPAQLTASKDNGKTYSATASDVWAAGVMLFAMLLGRFPYDHFDCPDPNSSGAHAAVWKEMQATEDGDWQKAARAAPHVWLLSDGCRDLLTRMLQQDEHKRITIPDIRRHPWFTAPLPTDMDQVIQDLATRQARLDHVIGTADEEQVKRRNRAVHELVVLAGRPHGSAPPPAASGNANGVAGPGGGAGGGGGRGSKLVVAIPEGADGAEGGGASGANSPFPAAHTPQRRTGGGAGGGGGGGGGGEEDGGGEVSAFTAAAAALAAAGGSVRCDRDHGEEVVVVDLVAVASRTKSDGLVLVGSATRERDPDGGCGCGSSDDTADSALVGLAAQEQQQAGQAEAPSVPGPGPGPGWASGAVPEGAPMAAASSGAAAEGEAAAATV
ncbi:hypothetical protein CHLRE_12g485600v5 [Chlamydomonas reinhardtii]|uniref:Protein kinase domain-containing protein n=1 Tax=Chlamydomonas reinhardtii TaxID=3055 RepID=A0A2K3D1R0_CHLRE|nr:uncharacterized protein CHLRE_12g485600v5 [Chlamydomonas reinhardtii]PNW74478.1 hypothetical protein CHLRE_12g485600v5 [Chlamydomonas reinhardtii]